ncbi:MULTISPECIES: DUF6891 domain-containing protein [unclassified Streptomyces]|uniref:DUF6891 domain-containing protein n=1 Tax=unclassified Streptomyces TaxID=2593676 RepID=UPI000DAC148A|nr:MULTISPECIES: hypothetical protein [unclassified Streptomyces]PZT74734.1 hypothetical protein DNK55_21925 [Streptomyces sp. AC1-42T]PZT82282.1 hypothetical protein DNK56_09525 [Streptomyces sp. AC1-42W]
MLEIKVATENQQPRVRVSEETLSALVHRIGGTLDHFLVVQRAPDIPGTFIQVWHETGGAYELEHRTGSASSHVRAVLDDPERVAELMTRWARQESGWDGGMVWESAGIPEPDPVPELPAEIREQLEARVRELLRGGYGTVSTLTEAAEDYLVKDGVRPVTRAQARQLVERLWLERVAEQRRWEGETDPERLARAFAALDWGGITAREHFTCCRSCGTSEIREAGREDARGFVFFHFQGTESAAAGHGLSLYYGGFDGSGETTAAVGREVVAALEEAGLTAEWDGSPDRAIGLTNLDWRKRLVG